MKDIIHSCQDFAALATFEGGGLRRSSFGSDGKASGFPGLDAAVEHAHVLVAEEFQEPKPACGAHAGIVLVEHNLCGFAYAAQFKHVVNHVHESLERRVAGIDQAQPEKVKVNGAGNRKSTRLNSSHRTISYAVFCLKKKKK